MQNLNQILNIAQIQLLYFEPERQHTKLILVVYALLRIPVQLRGIINVFLNSKNNPCKIIRYLIEEYIRNTCPTTLKLRGAHSSGLPREALILIRAECGHLGRSLEPAFRIYLQMVSNSGPSRQERCTKPDLCPRTVIVYHMLIQEQVNGK